MYLLNKYFEFKEVVIYNVSIEDPELQVINDLAEVSADEPESDIYYYHSDHLGSSSWITDAGGDVNQHLQYLPFGEDYIYQRTNSWNIPYTFSGKEKDSETGYSYFGARYYDSDISVWLSVDPLSDKYPSMSAYMYTAGNPVMLVDPDGRKIKGFSINKDGSIEVNKKKASKNSLRVYNSMIKSDTGKERFKNMVNSNTKIKMRVKKGAMYNSNGNQTHGETWGRGNKDGKYRKATIYISLAKVSGEDRFNNATESEMINAIGVHESVHAIDKDQIAKDRDKPAAWETERKPIELEYKSRTEFNKGNNSKFQKYYEDPNPEKIDPYGTPKPSFKLTK